MATSSFFGSEKNEATRSQSCELLHSADLVERPCQGEPMGLKPEFVTVAALGHVNEQLIERQAALD
jgi:hypothetical protein